MGIPGRIVLAVLRANAGGGPIGATKHHGRAHLTTRHIEGLGCRVDDMIHRLHGEVKRHEFDHGLEPAKSGTNRNTGKPMFGNWRINHPLWAKLIKHTLRYLIGALVFGHLFPHKKDRFIRAHLFGHGLANGLTHGETFKCRASRQIRLNDLHGNRGLCRCSGR